MTWAQSLTGITHRNRQLIIVGVLNGPIQFKTACKIWPLLGLLARIR